jgi:hypothetical protein
MTSTLMWSIHFFVIVAIETTIGTQSVAIIIPKVTTANGKIVLQD